MGNTNSRRYNLERPYGYPYRSYADSQMRQTLGATDRFVVSLPQLPNVVNENYLLYQLALARRDIFLNNYLRDRWLHCDLKCTPSRSLPHLPLRPPQAIPLPPPPLRHTASDEELERAAIDLCCRKRLLPPCTPSPSTKPLVCTKNYCEVLASKMKDACERKCFWKRFVSGELEEGESGGAGAALRIALEAPPLTCIIPPSTQPSIPDPPCAGQGLPLRPPHFACPPTSLNTNACPVICPGTNPVQNFSPYNFGDMQRALDSAWLAGVTASPTAQPSIPCCQHSPSVWVPPNTTPSPGIWNPIPPSFMPCTPATCPSQTQAIPPQFQHSFAPPPPLQPPPPPFQPPAPAPAIPNPQPCLPAQVQFAEALEVGCTSAGDVSVALYTDGVLEARARGVQSQCGRLIRSILSRRWTLPSGIRPEALWCFLGGGLLAVVTIPPPPTLISVLRAMQCLGRPLLVPYAFTQACGVVLT